MAILIQHYIGHTASAMGGFIPFILWDRENLLLQFFDEQKHQNLFITCGACILVIFIKSNSIETGI